ncbi:MAG: MOSC domain-containing protein [Thermoleophilaceae bacterium]
MGQVEAIHIAAEHEELPHPVESVRVVAKQGIVGDRQGERGDITLIEAEALEELARDHRIELSPAESRRQVLTRGIGLNDLVGVRFRVGEVECIGTELCEPCSHLEGLTQPGVIKGLVHRAGINADVLSDGEIATGDAVARC